MSSRLLVLVCLSFAADGRRTFARDIAAAAASVDASANEAFNPKPFALGVVTRPISGPAVPQIVPMPPSLAQGISPTVLAGHGTGSMHGDVPPPNRRRRIFGRLRNVFRRNKRKQELDAEPVQLEKKGPMSVTKPIQKQVLDSQAEAVNTEKGDAITSMKLIGGRVPVDLVPGDLILGTSHSDFTIWKGQLTTTDMTDMPVRLKVTTATQMQGDSMMKRKAVHEAWIRSRFSGGRFAEYYGWWDRQDSFIHIMEQADGDLQSLVIDQPFEVVDVATRLRLFTELVDGLATMNKHGFVHRSIWPRSILLKKDRSGKLHVKIADLGSACQLPDPSKPAGAIEQAFLCDSAAWGPESDVFAAGLVLYQMLLEGKLPPVFSKAQVDPDSPTVSIQEAWRSFDVRRDRLFIAAQSAAGGSQGEGRDPWLAEALSLLELMLGPSPDQRVDIQTANIALSDLDWDEGGAARVLRNALLDAR
eukprot:CAMPEP_0170239270 /NCGR_PEP_ID=MMETSP0116_2-20130129/19392_1 /TAXON_ID=400756 /ORGANISM="Durinskia baltica, Strain CSIRO CS-38" /LENGTH=473 /DNA_ID=CAMNT_0010490087 /DNA_START=70 /DNA_END=1491 /DNA_ORIENTATION=+